MSLYSRDSNFLAKWWYSNDHIMIFVILIIASLGLVMSYSISPFVAKRIGLISSYFYGRHIIFLGLFFITLFFFSLLSPKTIRVLSLFGLVFMLIMVFLVLFTEAELKGAKRWLRIFGFSFQPSEFLKPFFLVINAWFLSRKFVRYDYKGFSFSTILFLVTIFGLLLQPDIGMVLSYSSLWIAQLFLSSVSMNLILMFLFLAICGLVSSYFIFTHVKFRIDAFLFSGQNPTYQVGKSLEAIDSGGFFGRGLFEGVIKESLPDAHTDFIFASLVEELGIIMGIILLILYFIIVVRIFINLKRIDDVFLKMVLVGIAVLLSFQVFVNVGVNLNLLPTKGTTLPLISYGGSSMVATGILFGIMLSFSREKFGQYKSRVFS